VAVHDVYVQDGCAASLGCRDIVGEVGKIGGEDGGCQFDHLGIAPEESLAADWEVRTSQALARTSEPIVLNAHAEASFIEEGVCLPIIPLRVRRE
jgi:hypothetical protein